jgi:hypothetical protein
MSSVEEQDIEQIEAKGPRLSETAQCLRKTINTMRLPFAAMPDSPKFNPAEILPEWSAKFQRLLLQIRMLDEEDMKKHGTLFKHFIYTDIRESAYGAKAIASNLIAAGFELRMKHQDKYVKYGGEMVKTKDGHTVYAPGTSVPGGSNGFALLQSLPLWHTPLSSETKKTILRAFNARPDNIHGENIRIIVLDSKFKEGIDLFDVKYVHLMEPALATSDLKQAVGRATRFCGQMGLPFLPRRGWPLHVYIYNMSIPENAHELMMAHSGIDLELLNITNELTLLAIQSAVDYSLSYNINNFDIETAIMDAVDIAAVAEVDVPKEGGGRPKLKAIHPEDALTDELLERCAKTKSALFPFTIQQMRAVAASMKLPTGRTRAQFCSYMREVPGYLAQLIELSRRAKTPQQEEKVVEERFPTPKPPSLPSLSKKPVVSGELSIELRRLKSLPVDRFQEEVTALYNKFKWASPIVKSGCPPASTGKAASFTRTQDFVRHYLTPHSPFKGLFAWHSVGTGKTCMAVAAATTYFEQAGYTILWVTRNALMADVYKNLFGLVCSIPNMEKLKRGEELPDDLAKQRRALGRTWLPPISYRMFQNALEQKNELGRQLHAKHPGDPLYKTFLIIDEIHKLQDGDLSAAEAADFKTIQSYIHASYKKSGEESVRPLLMTATPITDTPHGLFDILNTLIPEEKERLVSFDRFRQQFAEEGSISEEGKDYFREKSKGLISYLNREFDPTAFSQPIFETIMVDPWASLLTPSPEALVESCLQDMPIDALLAEEVQEQDCDAIVRTESEQIKKTVKELKEQIKAIQKDRKKTPDVKEAELAPLQEQLQTLETNLPKLKEKHAVPVFKCKEYNKTLRQEVKALHASNTHGVLGAMKKCYLEKEEAFRRRTESGQVEVIRACLKEKANKTKKVKRPFTDRFTFLQAAQETLNPGIPLGADSWGLQEKKKAKRAM